MTPHPKTTAAKAAVKIKKQPVVRKALAIPAEAKAAPKPKPSAKAATPRAKKALPTVKAPKTPAAKGATKSDMLISMLNAAGGATSKEMEEAANWKSHSVRGFLGTLRSKGINITSKKVKGEPTVYRIVKAAPSVVEAVGDVV